MIELLILVLVLYLVTVAASFGVIKLVYDDIPVKYALIPVLNVIIPFLDHRGPNGNTPVRSPGEELELELISPSVSKIPRPPQS